MSISRVMELAILIKDTFLGGMLYDNIESIAQNLRNDDRARTKNGSHLVQMKQVTHKISINAGCETESIYHRTAQGQDLECTGIRYWKMITNYISLKSQTLRISRPVSVGDKDSSNELICITAKQSLWTNTTNILRASTEACRCRKLGRDLYRYGCDKSHKLVTSSSKQRNRTMFGVTSNCIDFYIKYSTSSRYTENLQIQILVFFNIKKGSEAQGTTDICRTGADSAARC